MAAERDGETRANSATEPSDGRQQSKSEPMSSGVSHVGWADGKCETPRHGPSQSAA